MTCFPLLWSTIKNQRKLKNNAELCMLSYQRKMIYSIVFNIFDSLTGRELILLLVSMSCEIHPAAVLVSAHDEQSHKGSHEYRPQKSDRNNNDWSHLGNKSLSSTSNAVISFSFHFVTSPSGLILKRPNICFDKTAPWGWTAKFVVVRKWVKYEKTNYGHDLSL